MRFYAEINDVRCDLDHAYCRETCRIRGEGYQDFIDYLNQTIETIDDNGCSEQENELFLEELIDLLNRSQNTLLESYSNCEEDFPPHDWYSFYCQ